MEFWQCPLCTSSETADFCKIPALAVARRYLHCSRCDLIFLDPGQRPNQSAERTHYELHNNVASDEQYCNFLGRLLNPLLVKIGVPPENIRLQGLDFGSGPGPVLAELVSRSGHQMSIYDPYFAPDKTVLQRRYDFVTCCEVAEHFYEPAAAFQQIDALLKPGGWLGLMTGILPDWTSFRSWHYPRDITHVVFYSPKTVSWIAEKFDWQPEFPTTNVVLFKKKAF